MKHKEIIIVFVKSIIFNEFKENINVMDLGSGKGQDLFRYAKSGVKKIVFLEKDISALAELINRKHIFSNGNFSGRMKILIQNMDLNDNYNKNIKQIENSYIDVTKSSFDLIISDFALHYLIADDKKIINIGKFIKHYLKIGGEFIFTCFDGKKIFNLLKKNNGEWKSKEKDKFLIRAKYNDKKMKRAGQKISVLLPFSKGDLFDEYLINIEYFSLEFKNLGFKYEGKIDFDSFISRYNSNNNLDIDDKFYVSLYSCYKFTRIK